jgi:hypothetical protein
MYIRAYNCILGRPTLTSLGGVSSTVQFKMKYRRHNNQVMTINADNKGTQRYIKIVEETFVAAKTKEAEQNNGCLGDTDFDPHSEEDILDEEKKTKSPLPLETKKKFSRST